MRLASKVLKTIAVGAALAVTLGSPALSAPPASAAPPGERETDAEVEVTREFLFGRWTDDGDCNFTIEFHADGSFTVPGGAMGMWYLKGDVLTFEGSAGRRSSRVLAPDRNTIILFNDDGSEGRSTRCPDRRRTAAPVAPADARYARSSRYIG